MYRKQRKAFSSWIYAVFFVSATRLLQQIKPNIGVGTDLLPFIIDTPCIRSNGSSLERIEVFYNVYFPEEKHQLSKLDPTGVVFEQLSQLTNSYANSNYQLKMNFNTIGDLSSSNKVQQYCKELGLSCFHLQHYPGGQNFFEEVTLQRLHNFCSSLSDEELKTQKVIYIHSKGTFNPDEKQNWWRRHMTMAVTDKQCLNFSSVKNVENADSCNVCGLLFTPFPFFHFSGNFFAAKCSYIKKLLPLKNFTEKLDYLATDVRAKISTNKHMVARTFPTVDAHLNFGSTELDFNHITDLNLGLGRFSSEHWVASHPDVTPCDLSGSIPQRSISYWQKNLHLDIQRESFDQMSFSLFPMSEHFTKMQLVPKHLRGPEKKSLRIREYYFLAGLLNEWIYLYNAVPKLPNTNSLKSWVWDYFPESNEWVQAIKVYGKSKVVNKMMKKFSS